MAQAPVLTAGRVATAVASYGAARRPADRLAAAHPTLALALVARHPVALRADLVYEGFFKGAGKPGFEDALRACLDYDFRDRLPEIRQPTLIVWGENDMIVPVKDAHEFERLIPDSRKLVMKDTGHVPMVERPATFNDCCSSSWPRPGPPPRASPPTASRRRPEPPGRPGAGRPGQPVTAPSAAEPTCFAYLPSTPFVYFGARRLVVRQPRGDLVVGELDVQLAALPRRRRSCRRRAPRRSGRRAAPRAPRGPP